MPAISAIPIPALMYVRNKSTSSLKLRGAASAIAGRSIMANGRARIISIAQKLRDRPADECRENPRSQNQCCADDDVEEILMCFGNFARIPPRPDIFKACVHRKDRN